MAYKLLDFLDIQTAVMEELKVQTDDLTTLNRVKRMINMMYMDEVVPAARWWWLSGHASVSTKKYFASGTVSVTPLSTSATLSVAPSVDEGDSGSLKGWRFSIEGKSDIYTITAHTALSTSITIDRPFNNDLNAAANFKIWKDFVALPTDCRETIEVWHDYMRTPMEAKGLQELRKLQASSQKAEGRPLIYSTYDFEDPTVNDDETESDRYRMLKIHPAIYNGSTMLKLDYVKEVNALDDDGDEPLMPVEDRIVLFYGALSLAWGSIGRNPEEAMRNRQLFEAKLARMMGKIQDTLDKPRIEPQSTYISAKRGARISGLGRKNYGVSGGSSYSAPSYLQNVTINGATITGNVIVNAGITIDGRDISEDGADLDAHILASTGIHGLDPGSALVGTAMAQVLTNKSIDALNNSITNLDNSTISATAGIELSKLEVINPYRVVVSDAAGVITENAALTPNELVSADANGQLQTTGLIATEFDYLQDAEGLTSATLLDNTAVATTFISLAKATWDIVHMAYSISRGTANREAGLITITHDGTSAAIAQGGIANLGTLGVTVSVAISGANLVVQYTTTNTGTNATFKYKLHKWLA